MKSGAIVFLLTLLTFSSSTFGRGNNPFMVSEALTASEIEIVKVNTTGWVKLQRPYDREEDIKYMQDSVAESLGANLTDHEILIDGMNKKIVSTGNYEGGNIHLTIEDIYDASLKKYEHAIIIDITQYGKLWNINNTGDRVTECLEKFGTGPPASITIEGYIDGRVQKHKVNKTIDGIFARLGAIKKDSIESDNLISICGYTNNIKYFINTNNKKVNINIACRYSPSDNKTYFWIGTPVINAEY